jgi:hypothetical protein
MQNRYVGDIGDLVKLAILRALTPRYHLGVAWWLFPDEAHNDDGRHIGYLKHPERWRHFDPPVFDALADIVSLGYRNVGALEAANLLPGTVFSGEAMPVVQPIASRRLEWFTRVQDTLGSADLVFVDPDNGIEPVGHKPGSAKSGKSILISELRDLAKSGRCLIVYHHHTRRKGGHHCEIEYWGKHLRAAGFVTVDALRAKPFSPRVFFLLNTPDDVRQRAEKIAADWAGWITWHPDVGHAPSEPPNPSIAVGAGLTAGTPVTTGKPHAPPPITQVRSGASGVGITTRVGYVNRNDQAVIRPTGNAGTDHGQYVYALRCLGCGHEYGANGSDIWQRRCPAHDRGAPGLDV